MKKIGRRDLIVKISTKLDQTINQSHISSVISIVFDELIKKLVKGKQVNIGNFMRFTLLKTKPKKYHNVSTGVTTISKSRRLLLLKLAETLRKFLYKHVDLAKSLQIKEANLEERRKNAHLTRARFAGSNKAIDAKIAKLNEAKV